MARQSRLGPGIPQSQTLCPDSATLQGKPLSTASESTKVEQKLTKSNDLNDNCSVLENNLKIELPCFRL